VARALDAATAIVALILVTVVALGVTGPPRLVLALAFVSFVPGWAVVGRSRVADGTSKLALAVATSLTVCTVTALAMAWLRSWHPFALFYALAVASVASVLRPPPRPGPAPVPAAPAATPAARLATPDPEPFTPAATPEPEPEPVTPAPRPVTPAATRATESPSHPRRQRRHTVQPENLRLTDVAVRVVIPTRPAFTVNELTDFFAGVHDRHPFTDLHLDSDAGAVMEAGGSRRLEIRRDSIDYREADEATRGNVVGLVDEVRLWLGVTTLTNLSCHLQARWRPDTVGDDPSLLLARAAGVDPGNLALLGSTEPVGVGLRFTGRSGDPPHDWKVVVEPDGRDGAILVDVMSDFGPSVEVTEAIGEHVQQAHRFLTETLAAFVESIVASPTGEH